MIKKILILTAILCVFTLPCAAEEDIAVIVDGNAVAFDSPPIIIEGRTLVPLRAIFEALGASVDWIDETETVFARKRLSVVSVQIGSKRMYVDGIAVEIDVPAQLVNDRTLVPVRAVSEALGAEVLWDEATSTVTINGVYGAHYVKDFYMNYEFSDPDSGELIISASCAYPQIENPLDSPAISAINDKLKADAEEFMKNAANAWRTAAESDYELCSFASLMFSFHSYQRNFDITSDGSVFAVTYQTYEYTGGVRPNVWQLYESYDVETGEILG